MDRELLNTVVLLIAFVWLAVVLGCIAYVLLRHSLGSRDRIRQETAGCDDPAPSAVGLPADTPAEPVPSDDPDERMAAEKWWVAHADQLLVVLRGKAKVVVVGTGTLEYAGAVTSWTDRQEYKIDGEATIKSTKMVRFDLAGPSTLIVDGMGTINGDREGAMRVEPGGLVSLGGKGKFRLRNCRRVTSSLFADLIEIDASGCGQVNAFSDVVLRADNCVNVAAGGEANVLAVRCDSVNAMGQSKVLAVECKQVLATDRAKVKARRCGKVSRRDEALVEEDAA